MKKFEAAELTVMTFKNDVIATSGEPDPCATDCPTFVCSCNGSVLICTKT